jgi:hypothetical protein
MADMSQPLGPRILAELSSARDYVALLGDRFLDAHPTVDNRVADPQVPLEAWTVGLPASSRAREHLLAITRDLDRAVHIASAFDGSTVRPLLRTLTQLQNQLCETCLTLGIDVAHCLDELHAIDEARRGRTLNRLTRLRQVLLGP